MIPRTRRSEKARGFNTLEQIMHPHVWGTGATRSAAVAHDGADVCPVEVWGMIAGCRGTSTTSSGAAMVLASTAPHPR